MQVTSDKHPFTVYHQYGEIMHKPGDNNYFVDQLSKDLKYIHKTKIKSYVMRTYGLTCKEYYGIVSHNDPNWVKLCDRPGCNNVAIFGIGWDMANAAAMHAMLVLQLKENGLKLSIVQSMQKFLLTII